MLIPLLLSAHFHNLPFESEIKAFIKKSPEEQILYMKEQELDVFKLPGPGVETPFTGLLPESSSPYFLSLLTEDTLGLYLSPHNRSYDVQRGTLLLQRDAGLWTLAHELTHALIDKERKNYSESEIQENLGNAKEDYEEVMSLEQSLGYFPSPGYALRAFHSMRTWTELQAQMLDLFEMEEVRIEKMLQKIYLSNPDSELRLSFENAPMYIRENCLRAVNLTEHASQVSEHVISKLGEEMERSLKSEIREHLELLDLNKNRVMSECSERELNPEEL